MCRHKISGVICAVKIVSKEFLKKLGASAIENMRKELITIQSIDHQYCSRVLQLLESEFNIYIVMEYIERGDLQNFIIQEQGLTNVECVHILRQLLDALNYLHHTKNIVHRDLKLENLLVAEFNHEKQKVYIKLTDFGFATECLEDNLSEDLGTPLFKAPEIV